MIRRCCSAIIFFLATFSVPGQDYFHHNIRLLSHLHPNQSTAAAGPYERHYMGCWGWKQESSGREFAIVGASNGVYFIDISAPARPVVSAFVPGKSNCGWREVKTYKNYCYVVSDDPAPNQFQIIDMSTLPSTVKLLHHSDSILQRGHTLYVEGDRLYVSAVTYSVPGKSSTLNVYSLADPSAPKLLRSLEDDFPIPYVHDVYVRQDTIYASCAGAGIYVLRFNPVSATFSMIGSYNFYGGVISNHSSSGTANGKHLVFCDESPAARVKIINTQNPDNIQPVSEFIPFPSTTPHNPYVLGNDWAFVSCYEDGLFIYDISKPESPEIAGYFDTHPQAGDNTSKYSSDYSKGNWSCYPYLPSGVVIASDAQNGIFILDVSDAFQHKSLPEEGYRYYPNPADQSCSIRSSGKNLMGVKLFDVGGRLVYSKNYHGSEKAIIETSQLPSGTYILSVLQDKELSQKILIIQHR